MVAQLEHATPVTPVTPVPTRTTASRASAVVPWLIVALSAALGLGAAWILRGSPFPPGGVGGDQGFRIASVARDAQAWFPTDFAYRGVPVFYPPSYFFLLGRLAASTGIPPYEALKIGTIVTAFAVPLIGFGLWRRLVGDVVTAAAVVVAGLALHDWYEPYAWLSVVVFVPWWFAFVVRVRADGGAVDRRRVVLGSLLGGVVLMTYYYPFFVGAVQLVVVLVASAIARRRRRVLPLRVTRESWYVMAGTAVVSSLFWAPLALRAVTTGELESLQNRYFEPSMITMPLPFLDLTVEGVVMAFGLVALVVGCRRSPLLLGLLTLLGAAYVWLIFGYVAVLANTPVLSHRAVLVIQATLLAAAGVGAVEAVRALRAIRVVPLVAAAGGVAVLVLVVSALAAMPLVAEQRAQREPVDLLRAFDRATTGRPGDEVVLATASPLAAFRPVYLFNVWNAHYSNPTAEFTARSRFLDRLAAEHDPAVFAAALRANRYDRVGAVVLDTKKHRLSYVDYQDNFPRGTRARTLTFDRSQFADRWFTSSAGGRYVVFVARPVNAVAHLDPVQRQELRAHFSGDLRTSD